MARRITARVLGAFPEDGSETTTAALAESTGLARKSVSNAVQAVLSPRGFAHEVRKGVYRLTDCGIAARKAGVKITSAAWRRPYRDGAPRPENSFRERLWRALRVQGKATVPELVALAASGRERNAERQVRNYLRALRRAGFVAPMRRREPGTAPTSNGFVRYLLVPGRDSGPEAPLWRPARGAVFDPNSGKSYALETGAEIVGAEIES